jgi:hypothetical protein
MEQKYTPVIVVLWRSLRVARSSSDLDTMGCCKGCYRLDRILLDLFGLGTMESYDLRWGTAGSSMQGCFVGHSAKSSLISCVAAIGYSEFLRALLAIIAYESLEHHIVNDQLNSGAFTLH